MTSSSDRAVAQSASDRPKMPYASAVPVLAEGQASRTNHASDRSAGAGRGRSGATARWMEAHQPLAPVPVPAMTPDDD